jgi:hypothetical protein
VATAGVIISGFQVLLPRGLGEPRSSASFGRGHVVYRKTADESMFPDEIGPPMIVGGISTRDSIAGAS